MITAQQFYYLECDEEPCLERFPNITDDTVAWADPVVLLEQGRDSDWLMWHGKHFCPEHVCWCAGCEDVIVPLMIKMCDPCREEAAIAKIEDQYVETSQPHKGD